MTDLLKRVAGIPLKPPSRPGTGTKDAAAQSASGSKSVIFCSGVLNTIAAVTEAVQAGLTVQGLAQLRDEDAPKASTAPASTATAGSSGTADAVQIDQLFAGVHQQACSLMPQCANLSRATKMAQLLGDQP